MEKPKKVSIEVLNQIYEIIEQIFKNKESHKKINEKRNGFLVQKNSFDDFKKYIHYDILEECVKDKNKFGNFKYSSSTLKQYIKFQILEKKISFVNFNNSQELINNLLNKKEEYYIINEFYGNKILKLENKQEEVKKGEIKKEKKEIKEKEIEEKEKKEKEKEEKEKKEKEKEEKEKEEKEKEIGYKITKQNIFIYFNDSDFITFKFNKEILIGESNLISQNKNLLKNTNENKTKIIKNETDNNEERNILNNNDINIIRNKYKDHIEILIRFFIYQKELAEGENRCFSGLTEQNKESVFLINSEWLKNLKEFFEYRKLEQFLIKYLEQEKINSNKDDKYYEIILSKIPNEYFNEFICKNEKKFEEKIIKDINCESYKIKFEEKLNEIKFFF